MRTSLALPASLLLSACATHQLAQSIGPNDYLVTASCSVWYCTPGNAAPNLALAEANKTCAEKGLQAKVISMQTGTVIAYPRWAEARFKCVPGEVEKATGKSETL